MANRYWDGGTSTDPTDVNNWSDSDGGGTPASSVPGTGDHAWFTANGDGNPCTLTAHWTLGNLTVQAGYTSKIDEATFNLTMDDGADVTLDGGGEFNCGSGSHSLTNGTFDYTDQTTLTRGTSTWTLNGTGQLLLKNATGLHNLTIPAGATITVPAASGLNCNVEGLLTLNGTLSIAEDYFNVKGTASIGASSRLTGAHVWIVPSAGEGITSFAAGGIIDPTDLTINEPDAASVIAAGTYQATVTKVRASNAAAYTLTLSSGEYTFTHDLEFENTDAGGSLTIANDTNNPTITVQGDVIWDEQAGTITYNKSSNPMTASGLVNQALAFGGQASENLIIDKPSAGNVTLANIDLTFDEIDLAGNLTVSSGDFDTAAGITCTISGDFTCDNNAADLGESTTWNFGGSVDWTDVTTFTGDGATINATGSGNVNYDLGDETIGAFSVNKSGGTLTFLGGFTADSFHVYSGTIDFNGDTFATTGNFTISASAAVVSGTDAMNDATITVGGDLRLDGAPGKVLNLSGTSEWTLNVTGTALIRNATVAYCNASGGSAVQARGCVDGGNNTNVVFLPADTNGGKMWNRWRRRPMIQRAS